MKAIKKISIILIILFITSVSGSVFAEDMNMDITYDIPSQANESDLTKEEKNIDRESYSKEAAKEEKEENTSENNDKKLARSITFKSMGTFTVSYVYASKANSSDKYATKATFKELKGYSNFNDALSSMNSYYTKYKNAGDNVKAYGMCITNKSGKVIAMKNGRVYATPSGATMNIGDSYVTKNHELYYYGAKANSSTQSSVNVGISGTKGYVSSSSLTLIPRGLISTLYKSASSNTKKYTVGYYSKNSSSELIHTYKTLSNSSTSSYFESGEYVGNTYSMVVDKAPSFMKAGTKYYSMDGVNFYTDGYLTNKAGTYYPYFKYLPYRTKSNYSASQFDSRIKTYSSSSVLRGCGKDLITAQNTYGINALMELSFANLESAYGTSGYAISRKNLFGIAATDSNPDGATYFKSAGDCIIRHAGRYLSQGYFDTKTDSRYFGTCPGDKKIGVAVKYASDPYHGEKIGGIAYTQDKNMGSKDYGRYTIGKTNTAAYVYQKASTSSKKLYRLGTKGGSSPVGMTVAVIGTSGNYYKVQTDMGIVSGEANYKNKYNFTNSVGYIPKSQISIVRKGSNSLTSSSGSSAGSSSKPAPVKLSVSSLTVKPSTSYGITPGYGNNLKVQSKVYASVKGAKVELRVYDAKERIVAKQIKTKKSTKTTTATFFWNGKATKENTAGYKTGAYVKRSSKGTKYLFKVTISAKGKIVKTKVYSTKVYTPATKLYTDISKTTIKRKSSTVLSMKPNRPGTSYVRIYDSKGRLVFNQGFYYMKANTKRAVSFKGYGNYGKYNKKLLAKGKYTIKYIHGSYTYKYPKKLVLK